MKEKYTHLMWLGAGSANEPSDLMASAESLTIVEARASACSELRKRYSDNKIKIEEIIVTPDGEDVVFTEYNLLDYSAIKTIGGLKSLFPGIRPTSCQQQKTISIIDLIKPVIVDNNNALIIDIIDIGFDLLKAIKVAELLNHFVTIKIHTAEEPAYLDSASTNTITEFLIENGYLLKAEDKTDPDLPWLEFNINPLWLAAKEDKANLKLLTEKLETNENLLATTQKELVLLNEQLASIIEELDTTKGRLKSTKKDLDSRTEELSEAIKELEAEKQKKLQNTLDSNGSAAKEISRLLDEKIQEVLLSHNQELSKAVGTIKNHIKNGLGNTAKQLEAFIGLQNYLEKGIKPLSFHGWPISPDIGLYIAGLIDENNYDVIIEFGSGTSTVLMAKAITANHNSSGLKNITTQMIENLPAIKGSSESDLPARIVTFEHHKIYYEKTLQTLKNSGVSHLVDLVYAPLVDYNYKDGSNYLYYNCIHKLQEISNIYIGRKAKILVLVDGPPGAINKNARFPALPHLLNTMPGHEYTIIMDDYNRAEEKEIMELWKNIFIERGITPALEVVQSEKGLGILSAK